MAQRTPEGWPVVKLPTELDLSTIDEARMRVRQALRPSDVGVVLDMADVDFFGSEGVYLVCELLRDEILVRMISPSPLVVRVIQLVGLEDFDGFELER